MITYLFLAVNIFLATDFNGLSGKLGMPIYISSRLYKMDEFSLGISYNKMISKRDIINGYVSLNVGFSVGGSKISVERKIKPFVSFDERNFVFSGNFFMDVYYSNPLGIIVSPVLALNYCVPRNIGSAEAKLMLIRKIYRYLSIELGGGIKFYPDVSALMINGGLLLKIPSLYILDSSKTPRVDILPRLVYNRSANTDQTITIPPYCNTGLKGKRLFLDKLLLVYREGNESDTVNLYTNGCDELPVPRTQKSSDKGRMSLTKIVIFYYSCDDTDKVPVVGKEIELKESGLVKTNLHKINLEPTPLFSRDTITLVFNKRQIKFVKRKKEYDNFKTEDFMKDFRLQGITIKEALERKNNRR